MSRSVLCLANVVLLTSHEVDGAHWHEWEMVREPGGIQGFLLLNIALAAVVLFGYRQVVRDEPSAGRWALVIAALGVICVALHAIFLLVGRPEFRLPVSLALLACIGVVSTLLLVHEVGEVRARRLASE